MSVTITRHEEFDAGHRVPNHLGKCCNMHGHRYKLEATVLGPVMSFHGHDSQGMILDFSEVKNRMLQVIEQWDHSFLVWDKDELALAALELMGSEHRTVVVPYVPTVENLVADLAGQLSIVFEQVNIKLVGLRLYETPNSWADYQAEL